MQSLEEVMTNAKVSKVPYYAVCQLLLKELKRRDDDYRKTYLEKDTLIGGMFACCE